LYQTPEGSKVIIFKSVETKIPEQKFDLFWTSATRKCGNPGEDCYLYTFPSGVTVAVVKQ